MDEVFVRTELTRLENLIKKQTKELAALRTDIFTHTHRAGDRSLQQAWAEAANADNEAAPRG